MPGGLIQIVAYGSQDIFLTSVPQITFFKSVYKKHTNFAIENIEIPINSSLNFDKRIITNIPKLGDLIHKIYLKITIPEVNLDNPSKIYNNTQISKLNQELITYKILLQKVLGFVEINYTILYSLKIESQTVNSNWQTINTLMQTNKKQYFQSINNYSLIYNNVMSQFDIIFPLSDKQLYLGSIDNNNIFINKLIQFIQNMESYYLSIEREIYSLIDTKSRNNKELQSSKDYFCWSENLGFNLIKKCSVLLGGDTITSIDSDYLNIHYSLNNNYFHENILNEMIGNTPNLTKYDTNIKQSKTLYIPLPLWFSQHNGNILPLLSLVYHDLDIDLEINSINKCCFYNGQYNLNNLINLGNCSFLVDYIYLDSDERNKFAQFSHEYLVQNTQMFTSDFLNIDNVTLNLDLYHPVKDIYWFIRETNLTTKYNITNKYYGIRIYEITNINLDSSDSTKLNIYFKVPVNSLGGIDLIYFPLNSFIHLKYTKYYDNHYKVILSDGNHIQIKINNDFFINYDDDFFGIIYNEPSNSEFNPIKTSYIMFNGVYRTEKTDSLYYNYVVPYQYYKKTPFDGLNITSFSLHPHEYQPSGSCNFSLIKNKTLTILLENQYKNYIEMDQTLFYKVYIYCNSYNVLRIHNGISGLVFSG